MGADYGSHCSCSCGSADPENDRVPLRGRDINTSKRPRDPRPRPVGGSVPPRVLTIQMESDTEALSDASLASPASTKSALSPLHSDVDDDANHPDDLYLFDASSNSLRLNVRKLMEAEQDDKALVQRSDGSLKPKSNLVRLNSSNDWDGSDVEDMMDEMKVQLASLRDHHSGKSNQMERGKSSNDAAENAREHVQDTETKRKPRHRRRMSETRPFTPDQQHEWDEEEVVMTLDDMSKELRHLMKASGVNTLETSPVVKKETNSV